MLKSVMKEVCIILLLSIAILLILGIVFYDYIPIGVTIPTKEAYETPDEVKNEINDETAESLKTVKTYEVTDSDLYKYKQKADYNEGKADPFALEKETSIENTNSAESSEIIGTNSTSNNSKNNTINEESDLADTLIGNEGIK